MPYPPFPSLSFPSLPLLISTSLTSLPYLTALPPYPFPLSLSLLSLPPLTPPLSPPPSPSFHYLPHSPSLSPSLSPPPSLPPYPSPLPLLPLPPSPPSLTPSHLQITHLSTQWSSKASVTQRKGRAGRCQAGHTYNLFTKEQYACMGMFALSMMSS